MERSGWAARRWYGAAASVVALAVLAGGIVAARDERDPAALTQLDTEPDLAPVAEPSGDPAPTADATVTATASATATRPGEPVPTVAPTAIPTGVPTVVPTGVPSELPTVRPTGPTPSAEPLVQVAVTDADLPTATKMLVTVRWRNRPGYYVETYPGDGHPPWTTGGCYHNEREDVTYGPEWAIARYEWSYRRAGTYQITAKLLKAPCHSGSLETIATSAPRQVRVTQGAVVANGPWLPHLRTSVTDEDPPNLNEPAPPRRVWVPIYSWDPDGWSWKYTIDWGDGSAPESHGIEDCWIDPDNSGTRQPFPDASWPYGGLSGGEYQHDMPAAGTYTVTVTAYSSACDAKDVQTTTRQMTVTVA